MCPLLDYNPRPGIYGICMGIARFCAEYSSGNLSHSFCSASITQSESIGNTGFWVGTVGKGRLYVVQIF